MSFPPNDCGKLSLDGVPFSIEFFAWLLLLKSVTELAEVVVAAKIGNRAPFVWECVDKRVPVVVLEFKEELNNDLLPFSGVGSLVELVLWWPFSLIRPSLYRRKKKFMLLKKRRTHYQHFLFAWWVKEKIRRKLVVVSVQSFISCWNKLETRFKRLVASKDRMTALTPNTGIGCPTGSKPILILFAFWLSFSHACANICSACTEVKWAGVGRDCESDTKANYSYGLHLLSFLFQIGS